jgi:hypothetical protein
LARPKRSGNRKRKTSRAGWMAWWPLLAGIAITLAAVKTAEILPLMGPGGLLRLQLLYPFAMLLKQPQLGLPEQTSDSWSQIMLYVQYPLYGLIWSDLVNRRALIWSDLVNRRALWVLWSCFRSFSRTKPAAVGAVLSDD